MVNSFYFLLFAISIPFWLIGSMADKGLPLPMNLPVSSLMFICPLIAALVLVYRKDKISGVKLLIKKVFNYKKIEKKIWYVPSLFLMPSIMFLSYWTMRLKGTPLNEMHFPFQLIPLFFVIFFISAVGEEVGWMGYAFERTLGLGSALKQGIIMGSVWAIWHAVPYIQAHNTLKWIAWQSLFSIAARVLIVWLYNNTEKSVLPGILFHTMINVSWSLFPNYGSYYDPEITGVIISVIVVVITFLWGAKTLSLFRYAKPDNYNK